MDEPFTQVTFRAPVLMPALVEGAFDYLVPEGTAVGALVEATLANRPLVGVVWGEPSDGADAQGASRPRSAPPRSPDGSGSPSGLRTDDGDALEKKKAYKLKPVMRVIDTLPTLSLAYMKWLDWISEFTLAPKGAVLSLCGLAHAAKTPKKALPVQQFTVALPELTPQQKQVAEALIAVASRQSPVASAPKPILLDGVTGSGKTEVYFHAIAAALGEFRIQNSEFGEKEGAILPFRMKQQILVLLPEISLTHQWLERFEKTFGAAPVLWHSRMTPVAKARAWQAVARGDVQVVVGARSALFLPFANLKLIIVDEEHDPSYKQEDGVLYHARDMAVVRARFEGIPIVLASATPSLETMENVRAGKYDTLHLPQRFGAAGLPEVRLVDMRNNPPESGNFLSPVVVRAALDTLARGEQVLFFLNRRGYAPLLLCRGCGHRFQCSHCSAWLVVHGKREFRGQNSEFSEKQGKNSSLQCHHCGHREPMPKACPSCKAEAEKLAACGPGVERIAEEVRSLLYDVAAPSCVAGNGEPERSERGGAERGRDAPRAEGTPIKLAVLSSDESVDAATWAAIEAGEIDVLVGTQMVAKGHHFPRLTLVVVVDADVGLGGEDLRAGERTYQMLHQLGGRAGRGELAGTVLIQTFVPDHPVMQSLVAHDRDRLMALEAKERKIGGWPPYGQLAAILLDGVDEAKVRAAGQMLARSAPQDARIAVLGPVPAPLSRLKGQYRYRILVKAKSGIHLQKTLRNWLGGQKFSGVRMKIDVNPYYFM